MRSILGILLLTTLVLRTKADFEVSAQAFTQNEFKALYELMVQYKYGRADNCPTVIKYDAHPTEDGDDLLIRHRDMKIGDNGLVNCTDGGAQRVTPSEKLTGRRLEDFMDSINRNLDKRTVFEGLQSELAGKRYYVSLSDAARTCGDFTWFRKSETFFYFDETDTIRLTVVAKITGGEPKFLSLPLVGNIRYMIAVTSGTSCIYRVQTDVANVILGSARPSDSPSPTPRPSGSPTPSVSPSSVPIPSSSPSATLLESASTSPSTSLSPSMSVSQTNLPTPSMSSSSSLVPSTPSPLMSSISSASASPIPSASVSSISSPLASPIPPPPVQSTSTPSMSSTPSQSASVSQTTSPIPSVSSTSSPSVSTVSSPLESPNSSPLVSSSSSQSALPSSSPSESASVVPSPSKIVFPFSSPSTVATQSPSPSMSGSLTPSPTPSEIPTSTPTMTASTSTTRTPIPTTPTPSIPISLTPEKSLTPTRTPIAVPTISITPFPSPSFSPSASIGSQDILLGSATPSTTPSSLLVPFSSPTPTSSATPSFILPGINPGNLGSDDRNSSSVDGTSTCFPGSGVVKGLNGVVRMDELKIGDYVWNGKEFSKVMMFTHRNSFTYARFVRLETGNASITLTGGHYVYVNGALSPARDVNIGDRLSSGIVIEKKDVVERGLYNPQTESGTIVVDGVLTSCYTDAVIPIVGHALLSPLRLVEDVIPGVVGALGGWIEAYVDGLSMSA